jgi:hypothetical protein
MLSIRNGQGSMISAAQRVRLLQDRIEYRREISRRQVDDLQDLGGRGLPCPRIDEFALERVAFSRPLIEFPVEIGDDPPRLVYCVVGHQARSRRSSYPSGRSYLDQVRASTSFLTAAFDQR